MIMMINSSADADAIFLPEWFSPSDRDVICGWARQNHRHAGNQRFRRLVEHSAPLYVAAKTKLEKTQVIASVVDKVRRDSPGGGFVKRDFHTGLWFEIGDDKARDKVGHAIRRAIEDGKKQKSRSGEAKEKVKGGSKLDAKAQSALSSQLPSTTLDDFDDREIRNVSKQIKAKSLDQAEGKLSSPFMASQQPYQDKSDSLVVPSFLYQQASALSNMQQEQAGTSGQPRGLDGHGLHLHTPGTMFGHQNSAQLLDALNHQQAGAGGRGDIQGRFSHQMNQLGHQNGFQSKLAMMNNGDKGEGKSVGNQLNHQAMSNFLAVSNGQPFPLDQLNPFGNASSFGGSAANLSAGMARNNQATNLENLMQFGSGASDLQYSLAGVRPTNVSSVDVGQQATGVDGFLGGLSAAGLPSLSSMGAGQGPASANSGRLGDDSSLWQHQGLGRGAPGM